jgi:hypothetical protein
MDSDKTKPERGHAGEVRQRKTKSTASKDKKSSSKSGKSTREKVRKADPETKAQVSEPEEPYVDILRRKFLKSADQELIVPDEDRLQLSWSNISCVVQETRFSRFVYFIYAQRVIAFNAYSILFPSLQICGPETQEDGGQKVESALLRPNRR